MASDSGTIYSNAAMLAAIWCAAAAVVPWRAMNKAISVKEVTSTMMASPAGTPNCKKPDSVGAWGRSSGRQSCKGV